MDSSREPGRRERKKADTRAALLGAAAKLFESKGFVHTTVHEIADAADVSERTFFRYFQSKDDLLLPRITGFLDAIAAEFQRNDGTGNQLRLLLDSVESVAFENLESDGFLPLPVPGSFNDSLAGRIAIAFMAWERRLAAIMKEKLSSQDADIEDLDLVAAVAARCGVAAMRSTLEVMQMSGLAPASDPKVVVHLLNRAFDIAASLGALPQKV